MSSVSGISGSVLASGYLSTSAYQALSPAQQTASQGVQSQLDNQNTLVSSLLRGNSSSASLLTAQSSNASSPSQLLAQSGATTQQQSQLNLVTNIGSGTTGSVGGLSTSVLTQWSQLSSLTQRGISVGSLGSSSASDIAASGSAAQSANQQALISTLYQAGGLSSSALTGTLLNQKA